MMPDNGCSGFYFIIFFFLDLFHAFHGGVIGFLFSRLSLVGKFHLGFALPLVSQVLCSFCLPLVWNHVDYVMYKSILSHP